MSWAVDILTDPVRRGRYHREVRRYLDEVRGGGLLGFAKEGGEGGWCILLGGEEGEVGVLGDVWALDVSSSLEDLRSMYIAPLLWFVLYTRQNRHLGENL